MKIEVEGNDGGWMCVLAFVWVLCTLICTIGSYNKAAVKADAQVKMQRAMTGGEGQQETVTQTKKVERL